MTALTYLLLWGFDRAGKEFNPILAIVFMVFDYYMVTAIAEAFK